MLIRGNWVVVASKDEINISIPANIPQVNKVKQNYNMFTPKT